MSNLFILGSKKKKRTSVPCMCTCTWSINLTLIVQILKKVTNGENLFFVQASVRRNIYRFTLMEKLVGLPTMNAFYLATVLIIKLIINCWLCYLAQLRLKVTGKQPEYFKLR